MTTDTENWDWEVFRRTPSGAINLVEAWFATGVPEHIEREEDLNRCANFLEECQELRPIVSRQAASIALAMANALLSK